MRGDPVGGEKMPRVVPDQRSKFENEEFFRKLSRECEVRGGTGGCLYTGGGVMGIGGVNVLGPPMYTPGNF